MVKLKTMETNKRRVVITGMGVVSPVGNDVETFLDSIMTGKCGIGMITKFNTDDLPVKVAAEIKDFDPAKDGLDTPFVRRNDLFAVYAMAAACQAMKGNEDGWDADRLGVYIGSGIGGFDTMMREMHKLEAEGPRWVSPLMIPTMIANMAAGNVAIRFNAHGVCLPVVTACATSTHAIGEAYRAIKDGYADGIIAGGTEAPINRLSIAGFANCKALTKSEDPNAASLPFDARRAGFVIAEGAGIVLLEEYEHAKQRGAKIYAEVCGYGNTCDGHHVTAPHPEGTYAAKAIKIALDEAGYQEKKDLLYINAHGTGTALNDSSETMAIKKAMGEDEARRALISSTKSMTGHLLGAAGAIEIIASALALQKGMVPPTINLNEADPVCDLNYTPNKAVKADLTIAVSQSLGFGGHNGAVALRPIK
jgi:3-oxoacyl-[acyl-carrier-protein] synthase II